MGVDVDSLSSQQCRHLFASKMNYHPHIVNCDAREYLRISNKKFDLIWVDLYDARGPIRDIFDPSFWYQLKSRLNTKGVIAINIYGIANHLEPYLSNTPLKAVWSLLNIEFCSLLALPHRRNTTLLASNVIFDAYDLVMSPPIDRFDLATLKLQQQRVHKAISFGTKTELIEVDKYIEFSFYYLNELQQKGWSHFLSELNSEIDLNLYFTSPLSLVRYLKDPSSGISFIDALWRQSSSLATMVPTFMGADIHNHDEPVDWYFDYLTKRGPFLANELPELWEIYFLPQWVSMCNSRPSLRSEWNMNTLLSFFRDRNG